MPVSRQLCFLNLVTFLFLYVCTPGLWAVYAQSCPWHVWKAQIDLDLYIFLHGDSGFSFLIGIAQKFHFCLNLSCQGDTWWLSCLMYSGADCECFSGVWSFCSDCVHFLFCNKASAYFKINRDGIYFTLSAVKSDTF